MIKKRRRDKNAKSIADQKESKTEETDSLDSLIAQLPLPPLHSSDSTKSSDNFLLETSDVFPEDLEIPLESELVEKISLLQAENEKLIKEKTSFLTNQKSSKPDSELAAEQKKIIKTNYWKIGNLENQLKWQREQNMRNIAEFRQKDAQRLKEREQIKCSFAEKIESIETELNRKNDGLLARNRREIATLEAANKKLIEEKRLLSDDKWNIEILLKNQKNENKSLFAQNSQNSELLAEQKKIIKTNYWKIGNLEKQLVQKNEISSQIATLEASNKKLIEEKRLLSDDRSKIECLLKNQKNENKSLVAQNSQNPELAAEQKKIIKTNYWKIGNLENQLKWQREENLRIIAEYRQKDAQRLKEREQIECSFAEKIESIELELNRKNDGLLASNRREIATLEAANKKLIEEKRLLGDDKWHIEILLKNQKNENKSLVAQNNQNSELLAEQKKIIETNYWKIGNLEKQLVQKNEISSKIATLEASNKKLIRENRILIAEKSRIDICLTYQENKTKSLVTKHKEQRVKDFYASSQKIVDLEVLLNSQEEKHIKIINYWKQQYAEDVGVLRQILIRIKKEHPKIDFNYNEFLENDDSFVVGTLEEFNCVTTKSKQMESPSLFRRSIWDFYLSLYSSFFSILTHFGCVFKTNK